MDGGRGAVTTLRSGARTCEDEPDKPVRLRGGRTLLRLFGRVSSVRPIGLSADRVQGFASRRHRAARTEARDFPAAPRIFFERDPAVR